MGMILTFDVGTTSMKCCVFDEAFRMVTTATTEYKIVTSRNRVEADPELYWQGLCSGIKAVLSRGVRPEQLDAVAFTTQGETMITLDENNRPVMPALVWLDERAGTQAKQLTDAIGAEQVFRTTGLPALTGAAPIAKLK